MSTHRGPLRATRVIKADSTYKLSTLPEHLRTLTLSTRVHSGMRHSLLIQLFCLQVLAMLCSGEIRSIDLGMLERGSCTENLGSAGLGDPQEWPIVTAASEDVAESLECVLPRRVSGGSATLLATVKGGALLGEFGKVVEGTCAATSVYCPGLRTPLWPRCC